MKRSRTAKKMFLMKRFRMNALQLKSLHEHIKHGIFVMLRTGHDGVTWLKTQNQ